MSRAVEQNDQLERRGCSRDAARGRQSRQGRRDRRAEDGGHGGRVRRDAQGDARPHVRAHRGVELGRWEGAPAPAWSRSRSSRRRCRRSAPRRIFSGSRIQYARRLDARAKRVNLRQSAPRAIPDGAHGGYAAARRQTAIRTALMFASNPARLAGPRGDIIVVVPCYNEEARLDHVHSTGGGAARASSSSTTAADATPRCCGGSRRRRRLRRRAAARGERREGGGGAARHAAGDGEPRLPDRRLRLRPGDAAVGGRERRRCCATSRRSTWFRRARRAARPADRALAQAPLPRPRLRDAHVARARPADLRHAVRRQALPRVGSSARCSAARSSRGGSSTSR